MSDPNELLLVLGAGNAGAELALQARQHGWAGPIHLVGDEPHLPYHRPPLSKAYLSGQADAASLEIRQQAAFDKAQVTVQLGVHAKTIHTGDRVVALSDGTQLAYAKLALCTGGRARPLTCAGLDNGTAPNLHYLRTRADADHLRDSVRAGTRVAIVGGGYVGLEVAASATKLGAHVVLLESQPRVLARVTAEPLSRFYEDVHRQAGVDIRTHASVANVELGEGGRICALTCQDGERIAVDLVVAGVGMLPNAELAEAAGLAVDGGIVVDAYSQTSDPHIVAAGDCTTSFSTLYGRSVRLESVPNALEQARAAALNLCAKPKANESVPWFWSDQYDLKLQMVGLSQGFDSIVLRGSMAARSFVAFYFQGDRLIAADAVNRPADFMIAKRLVGSAPADVRQFTQALADEGVPLKSLLPPPPAKPA